MTAAELSPFAQVAHQAATRPDTYDVGAALQVAVDQALTHIRAGDPGYAEYVLARALTRCQRITREAAPSGWSTGRAGAAMNGGRDE